MSAGIALDRIGTASRIRQADPEQVARLAASMAEVGLLSPVTVAEDGEGFRLIAGLHRIEAARALGWATIPAAVVDLDEHRRVIAECDENLCGPRLTAVEHAEFTARRKAAYLALHPETASGGNVSASFEKGRQVGDEPRPPRFTEDQASATGQSERVVQRSAERGEKVAAGVLDRIRGTFLDTGAFLDRVKRLPEDRQMAEVDRLLATPAAGKRSPKAADPKPKPEAKLDPSTAHKSGLAALTREGLEDEVVGLRAENAELREKLADAEARVSRMADDLAAFEQEGDMGRKLGEALRRNTTLSGRLGNAMQATKRLEYILRTKGFDAKGQPLNGGSDA